MDQEIVTYIQKAAMFDAVMHYVRTAKYVTAEGILDFCGGYVDSQSEEDNDNAE